MSKFEELQTEIRSTRFLGEALSILGHAPEMHPGGVTIKDYDGSAYPQPVEVVVRKTGSFLSDFGFAKGADGRLALVVDDFEAARKRHKDMGCLCYENSKMGIYFIEDPDGYWVEILPEKR